MYKELTLIRCGFLRKKIMQSDQNYNHKTMLIVIVSRTFLFV